MPGQAFMSASGSTTNASGGLFPLASVAAGLLATFGTLAALLERDRCGLGQHVETSLFEAALYMNGSAIMQGDVPPMHTQSRTAAPRVHIYPTADGWLQVVAGTRGPRRPSSDSAAASGNGACRHLRQWCSPRHAGLSPGVIAAREVMAAGQSAEWDRRLAEPASLREPADRWTSGCRIPLAEASKLAAHWERITVRRSDGGRSAGTHGHRPRERSAGWPRRPRWRTPRRRGRTKQRFGADSAASPAAIRAVRRAERI